MLQRREAARRRRRPSWLWTGPFLAAILLAPLGAAAQQPELTVQLSGLTADDWPRAQAVVTVLGADGRPLPGLAAADFRARLNGQDVPLTEVTQGVDSSLAIDVVLALDVSGSMEGAALEQARAAAVDFLAQLGPQDQVAVVTLHSTVDVVLPFTGDRATAQGAIEGLTAAGATALYQGTVEALRLAAAGQSSRHAVVLLSDGVDNGSNVAREDALSTAATLGVPVFAIGLGADIDRAYLDELANVSGGQFAETPTPEGLTAIYQAAGELLRGQYILTLDASELGLDRSQPATLWVGASAGELSDADERAVCPQEVCIALPGLVDGQRLEAALTLAPQVVSSQPVISVALLIDGNVAQELGEPPYEFALDPAAFEDGGHTLAVEAATASARASTGAVGFRIEAAGGGSGISPASGLLGVVVVALAALTAGAALAWLRRRRRRGGQADGDLPADLPPPSPGPTMEVERGPRRPVLSDEPAPPELEPAEPLGRLLVAGGDLAGQEFSVGASPISIGTGHRCLVRLPADADEGIAGEHARVWVREGHLMVHELRRLTALGSAGGRWEILIPGETFVIGPFTFQFELLADENGSGPPGREDTTPGDRPESASDNGARERTSGAAGTQQEDDRAVPNVLREHPASPPAGGQDEPAREPEAADVPNVLRERPAPSAEGGAPPDAPDDTPVDVPNVLRDHPAREAGEDPSPID